jgi:hypothetical protein
MIKEIFNSIKSFFGENNEFVQSTNIALRERLTSPFYGYFICSWFLFNWKIFYVAFFVDQNNILSKTGLLRDQYLQQTFPVFGSINFYLHFIFYPFFATILFFWIFPYLTREYYRKSLKNQKALQKIEIQESIEIKKEEKKLIQEETKVIDENIKKSKQEKRAQIETPEVLWEKEYKEFLKSIFWSKLDLIIDSIYEHGGDIKIYDDYNNRYTFQIPKDILVYAHTNELVTLDKIKEKIELTEKGKFFVKRFSDDKAKIPF